MLQRGLAIDETVIRDALSSITIDTPAKGRGWCSRITSSRQRLGARGDDVPAASCEGCRESVAVALSWRGGNGGCELTAAAAGVLHRGECSCTP